MRGRVQRVPWRSIPELVWFSIFINDTEREVNKPLITSRDGTGWGRAASSVGSAERGKEQREIDWTWGDMCSSIWGGTHRPGQPAEGGPWDAEMD